MSDDQDKPNPFGWGVKHEFYCEHNPCVCQGERVRRAQSALWSLLMAARPNPTLKTWVEEAEAGVDALIDHLHYAWTIIANGGFNRGGWETQDPEWVAAAEKWRDTFHDMIGGPT